MTLPGPHAAYLRVYEPVTAFPEPDRAAWASYAIDQSRRAETRVGRLVAEQRQALAGVLSVPPRPVPAEEEREAFLLEVDSVVHVCPVQSRLRSWVALGEFREGLPMSVLHAFVPPLALERAEQDHERWARDEAGSAAADPDRDLGVPLQWFVPFAPADRLVDLSGAAPDRGAPDPDVGGPAPGRPGAADAAGVGRRRRRGRGAWSGSGAGSRSSTPGRGWSWTTPDWPGCSGRTGSRRTPPSPTWPRRWPRWLPTTRTRRSPAMPPSPPAGPPCEALERAN